MSPPPKSQHPQLFTCTFCWHLSRGPPHACGEVVFRGEECVSLGWCFWHRACYGCLLCGSRLVVTGPKLAELFIEEDRAAANSGEFQDEHVAGLGLGSGREITEVPTCANCKVACEIDTVNRQTVVQNVLRRVDRIDGGMARQRWERGDGHVSRQAVGEIKRVPARKNSTTIQTPVPPTRPQWLSQVRAHTSHTSRLAGDGALSSSDDEGRDCVVPLDSTIYVSILDPIGEPAFKPSPTKPIPRWMQWLPSQRKYSQQNEVQPRSILDEHFSPRSGPPSNKESQSKPKTVCPTTPPQAQRRPAHPQLTRHIHVPGNPEPSSMADSTIKALKGPSFVLDEPLKRPSSRVTGSSASSPKTTATAKGGGDPIPPPPYLFDTTTLSSPRSRSPYHAPRKPSPLGRHHEGKAATAAADGGSKEASWNARLRRPSSPLTEQVVAHFQRYMRRTPPAQSREFINLYQPTRARPSIGVAGREGDKVLAGGRQVRSILDRDHTPEPEEGSGSGSGGARGVGGVGQAVMTDGGDVVDLRSMRKRSSLQSELKKLLGGGRGQGRERG
ncbi:hypothetical protein Hte_011413 [Hypoxylon texense]